MFVVVCATVGYGQTRENLGKADEHRRPLEQIFTGDKQDGEKSELYQCGFVHGYFGELLYVLWLLVPIAAFWMMLFFTLNSYLYFAYGTDFY